MATVLVLKIVRMKPISSIDFSAKRDIIQTSHGKGILAAAVYCDHHLATRYLVVFLLGDTKCGIRKNLTSLGMMRALRVVTTIAKIVTLRGMRKAGKMR